MKDEQQIRFEGEADQIPGYIPGDIIITLIENAKQKDDLTIILVVREHLITDVVSKFNLKDVEIITKDKLSKQENFGVDVTAVILGGGESSRMKTDKFLLKYDGVEQYKRLQNIFDKMNINSILSCNENQFANNYLTIDKIVDEVNYLGQLAINHFSIHARKDDVLDRIVKEKGLQIRTDIESINFINSIIIITKK
jgi:hypothetical protein